MNLPGPTVSVSTQRATSSLDIDNGVVTTYANNLSGIEASLQYDSGSEVNSQFSTNYIQYANFYIKLPADIVSTDRIIYNNRVFDIKAVLNRFEEFIKVIAVEVAPSSPL